MFWQFLILLLGVVCLWVGADLLVKYASRFARMLGVSPVIVGLSVVSMGTSAPEFVVSFVAAIQNDTGISMGNIVGSNIANIGLILGIGALITPLHVKMSWIKREVPFMIAITIIFIIIAATGLIIQFWEGFFLFLLMIFFLAYLIRYSAQEMTEFKEFQEKILDRNNASFSYKKKILYLFLSLVGAGILVVGSKLTVDSGVKIATMLEVSDLMIGLTLIAVGTSLPELATTIAGAFRKETDIVVGNIIGSNIFNLLFIGGLISMVHPLNLDRKMLYIQFPILILLSVLMLPIMRFRLNVRRIEGLLLLIIYGAFLYATVNF